MNSHFREQDSFTHFLELTPLTRQRLENAIETLVILLDDFDGDPDFEPDKDDEPNGDEEPDVDDEPDHDDEPEMRWTKENRFDYDSSNSQLGQGNEPRAL